MVPPDDLTVFDLPGRIAENAYLDQPPSAWPVTLVSILLHILAALVFIGLTAGAFQTAALLDQQIHINQATYQLIQAAGLVIAATAAMILIAIGQALAILLRIEKQTRQTKELAFYTLRKSTPQKH